jgi:acetylornithine/N-succinyldiaminopimelate aminotransferase
MNNRQLFQQYLAPTSGAPVGLEIVRAEGNYLYGSDHKAYLDLIGGISVCNLGHRHPAVTTAIHNQVDKYLHIMVYGELVQSPQVQYAELLASLLPPCLNCVYFTSSGSEATDGALKLARRATGRPGIIACHNSYHGHTMGALSIMGDEYWRSAFRPLLPGVQNHTYNSQELIDAINTETACVVLETIQAEAGVVQPAGDWLSQVRQKCNETGVLLVLDEIQCGFGRTGKLWGFEHFGVVPDIVLFGKALGGGMPLGAFVASRDLMHLFTERPVLGHITTFGGHPVSCAAGKAALHALLAEQYIDEVAGKEALFTELLQHASIKSIRSKGLLMALELESDIHVRETLARCLSSGLFSDWFLFAPQCLRIAPPLTFTTHDIERACELICACL